MSKTRYVQLARNAKNGQYVSMTYTKKHPNTTVVERDKVKKEITLFRFFFSTWLRESSSQPGLCLSYNSQLTLLIYYYEKKQAFQKNS